MTIDPSTAHPVRSAGRQSRPSTGLHAAILDFDGLIMQTEYAGFASLQALFAAHGTEYHLSDYHHIVGTTNEANDPFALLEQRTGRTFDRARLAAERSAHEDHLNRDLAPLPGVLAVLDQADALGWALGIASSSTHDWVDRHLRRADLFDRFSTVVCRGDAPAPKPAPDLYLEATSRLGIAPDRCIAFEDSYNGSIAAKRAGLRCVAVPHDLTRSQDFSHCDLIVDSLAEIDLGQLSERFG